METHTHTEQSKVQNTEVTSEPVHNEVSGKVELGCVKWFNNKRGYGFITYKNDSGDVDIFVHHSGVQPLTSQYRTLTTGEYVNFVVKIPETEGERNQAVNVTGVNGGPLLCDQFSKRRHQFNYEDEDGESEGLDESGEQWHKSGNRQGSGKGGKGGKGGNRSRNQH